MIHSNIPQTPVVANVPLVFNETVSFQTEGISEGKKLIRLEASASKPLLLKAEVAVLTAFNAGATNELTVGTDATSANQILGNSDITEGTPGFYPAGAQTGKLIVSQQTDIFVKFAGAGALASGTVTVSSTGPDADEELVVDDVTFVFKASPDPLVDEEIEIDTTPADQAVLIRDAINTHPDLTEVVTATAAAGVVTITATDIGTAGNALVLTEAATNVAVSGAGTLTGGLNAATTGAARVFLTLTPLFQGT